MTIVKSQFVRLGDGREGCTDAEPAGRALPACSAFEDGLRPDVRLETARRRLESLDVFRIALHDKANLVEMPTERMQHDLTG